MAELSAQVAQLGVGDDLYLQVDAQDPNKQTFAPTIPPRASQLLETFQDEDLYLRPAAAKSSEWHDVEAKKHGFFTEEWYYGPITREKAERLVLDQPQGNYLVRVSIKKNKKNYAITVAMGNANYLHISLSLMDSGEVKVDGVGYKGLRAAIDHFKNNPYKDIVKLTMPVVPRPKQDILQQMVPPPLPNRRPESLVGPPPPPRRASAGRLSDVGYEKPKFDFDSDHIYASTISSDEEEDEEDPVYLQPQKARAMLSPEKPLKRNYTTVKKMPLPVDVTDWTAAEVQRFLKTNGLGAFVKPFYANGVTGVELVNLKGSDFPKTRYSEEQCQAFDDALEEALFRQKTCKQLEVSPGKLSSDAAKLISELPPPVPSRSGRS